MSNAYREAAKRDPDPVQSLRVASTLADRYRAVASGTYVDTSAVELAIGEAQQIYPEIWRHLDEARSALAARDRDVRAYDKLRGDALRTLGVTHVDSHLSVDLLLNFVDIKTATFNMRGHQLAVAACHALMQQMPEVDFGALARAEDNEIRAAGSLRSARWIGIAKWVGLVGGLAAVVAGIHHFATRKPSFDDEIRAPRERLADGELSEASRQHAELYEQIRTLKRQYLATCDRQVRDQYAAALRKDNREPAAKKLETEKCVPPRPGCGDVAAVIARRQADAFGMEHAKHVCMGAVIAAAKPGFVIAVAGKIDGERAIVRGVVSLSGEQIVVPFASSPENAELAGVTDLDGDEVDELVMASERGFVISKIEGNALRDILGPPVTCQGTLSVQKDFREGRTKGKRLPVLTIPDADKPVKGCPEPGDHYFTLVDGKLVDD